MARFTSSQWAIVEVLQGIRVICMAEDSQSLFLDFGLRTESGKLSLKQAVYKLNKEDGHSDSRRIVSLKDGVLYTFNHLRDIGKGQADYHVVDHTSGLIYDVVNVAFHAKKKKEVVTTKIEKEVVVTEGKKTAEQLMIEAMQMIGGGAIDVAKVQEIVKEEIRVATLPKVQTIEVKLPTKDEVKKLGQQHYLFQDVLESVADNSYVLLKGDAGSGKTYGAVQIAKALGLDYRIFSFTNEISLSRCVGYMDAMGNYVKTSIREMYENGGLLILDEFDAMNPNVAVSLNNMLSGDEYTFPDAVVSKHDDFRVIACTNTFGNGADKDYSSRNKLDKATLDRFDEKFDWGYDEDLEIAIFGNTDATKAVLAIRKNAKDLGITITPRRTKSVNKMVNRGVSLRVAVERAILCEYKSDQQRAMLEGVRL
jgi:MoxR-like ATPase